jgi:hypothetical protein
MEFGTVLVTSMNVRLIYAMAATEKISRLLYLYQLTVVIVLGMETCCPKTWSSALLAIL